ncbi:hypothetical protein GUJ93_ZPchr0002g23087 [Zizania palustris]|uniref:Uncharacterized protein n=1 Tax=Zizania palustris TaxID=103762 RepID=A0A8J5V362_ZIZPA|nr:hypothetical protein GUJ93_ZPchr0002g23087 [Zizania palustris]
MKKVMDYFGALHLTAEFIVLNPGKAATKRNQRRSPSRKKRRRRRASSTATSPMRTQMESRQPQSTLKPASSAEPSVSHRLTCISSATNHVTAINSHCASIVCLMLVPSVRCIPPHTIVLICIEQKKRACQIQCGKTTVLQSFKAYL